MAYSLQDAIYKPTKIILIGMALALRDIICKQNFLALPIHEITSINYVGSKDDEKESRKEVEISLPIHKTMTRKVETTKAKG